ncbi:SAM-dependent methyltransferase [Nocardia altamirensis]|uniref:SAM-dependent methyltransferase n=1 Tax=Nocardia altamirensis TaxID=472158 RepID=UPI00114CEFF8|nr:SAM-dependent methyltransferase [Nocardia altamirensis]
MNDGYLVSPVGWVEIDGAAAPEQGDGGAPIARIRLRAELIEAAVGLRAGGEVLVLTWLHRADRAVLVVYPRCSRARPPAGVFATSSPHRPNPVGLHRVTVVDVDGPVLTVRDLEALDGTPVIDVKPVLGGVDER